MIGSSGSDANLVYEEDFFRNPDMYLKSDEEYGEKYYYLETWDWYLYKVKPKKGERRSNKQRKASHESKNIEMVGISQVSRGGPVYLRGSAKSKQGKVFSFLSEVEIGRKKKRQKKSGNLFYFEGYHRMECSKSYGNLQNMAQNSWKTKREGFVVFAEH